ncbi:MAG TPA: PRC-barrel domain-containing protein [Phnomibacter sp.]|nr:PRC-barrel domain-containing protein [Phnomibacter sp.]
MQDTISIGKLVATFGLGGDLVLQHGLGCKTDLKGLKVLFLEIQRGSTIPYFVESAQAKSLTETRLKLEGLNTKEEARTLLQKQVWIGQDDFERLVASNATIALLGYDVVENKKLIGTISEVIEQPHQVICSVLVGGKEALIPLNEATLQRIDRKEKKVHVTLPEGLLDIYLQ